jgi:hypothetical protein
MKAKVLKRFKDKHTGELHQKGTTITVSKERFEEILTVGPFVEAVKTGKTKEKKETSNG